MGEYKKFYWLKLKDDFFRNKEIKKLRKIAGGDTYTIIYLKMQLLSLKNGGRLIYDGVESSFAEEMALELDENIDDIKLTLAFLQSNNLIEQVDSDEYFLNRVPETIGGETDAAKRMRESRMRKSVTLLQPVTNGYTERREKKKEKEKEIELDKNNILTDVPKKEEIKKRFVKPTREQVVNYCLENNYPIDVDKFIDHYESKGWLVGKSPMKDWQASVRNWARGQNPTLKPAKKYENERNNDEYDNLF